MNVISPASSDVSLKLVAVPLDEVETLMLKLINGGIYDTEKSVPVTVDASTYHLQSGGQRVRARLALHSGTALGLAPTDSVALAAAAELLHNASLVHDDLHDREKLRRGTQTVWAAYGDEVAICVGDLLLSAAYGALATIQDSRFLPELIALVHNRVCMVIRGQCAELSERGQQVADMSVYEKIAVGKSGALLSLPLEMVFIVSGRPSWMAEARRAAEAFGVGYQIVDDMEDLENDSGGDAGPRAVNALLVLKAAGCEKNAHLEARNIALRYLKTAVEAAEALPNDSGAILRELAQALCRRM